MISFECDYIAGAHPEILKRLAETNFEQLPGYGADKYSESAKEKIKKACLKNDAEVHFLSGGTQTNSVVISSLLRGSEGVISPATGHIAAHEAGAIEYTGHKVLTLPSHCGKLDAEELSAYLADFYADEAHIHMVSPRMVYISHPTEYGTLYSKKELSDIYGVCRKHDLVLFIDGARLGYGLAARQTDLSLPDIARLCDVFYIGGTKVGALIGEAVVFTHGNTPANFFSTVKQHGALLAKGRLLGIQFDTLFTDGLYLEISRHAIDCAERLKALLIAKGYELYMDSPTNQQFVILENERMKELSEKVGFCFWEKIDQRRTAVRFATSWSTAEEDMRYLEDVL